MSLVDFHSVIFFRHSKLCITQNLLFTFSQMVSMRSSMAIYSEIVPLIHGKRKFEAEVESGCQD